LNNKPEIEQDYLELSEKDVQEFDIADEFDLDKMPSLDDLLRELEAEDSTPVKPAKTTPKQSAKPSVAPTQVSNVSNEEVEALKADVSRLETEKQQLHESAHRLQADFENYRKRTERERLDNYQFLVKEVVLKLLPVSDNLIRAFNSTKISGDEKSADFQQFINGIELVYLQLHEVLGSLGVKPASAVGDTFDPRFHEAVATEEVADVPPNTIIEEMLRGYRMGDKLIRPALVKVSV
jgi:molecular chaperone GrpE